MEKGARTMTTVARIFTSLGIMFLVLFLTIFVLLLFFSARLSSTVFANPTICKVPCMCKECAAGGGPTPLSVSPIDGMLITYEWPDQINLNSSDTIRMKITSNNAIAASQLTATVTGNYRVAGATPEEVGTPGMSFDANGLPVRTSVNDAFGPKYRVFATAQLLAATFDVKTFDLTEQSLDQGSVAWLWDIKPNTLGSQVAGLALDLLWKPINGGQAIQDQVWQTQIPITITQSFLDRGQLSLATLITGALAAGGIISGIIPQFVTAGLEPFRKKRDKDKGEVAQPKAEQEHKTGVDQQ
jgi:hypothetical protein